VVGLGARGAQERDELRIRADPIEDRQHELHALLVKITVPLRVVRFR
jgi:hypothetical protein